MENNTVTWYEVYSPDVDRTKSFYQNLFGWSTTAMDMGPEVGTYHMLGNGEMMHTGIMNTATEEMKDVPPHWLVYFYTADINESVSKLTGGGGKVMHGPMEIPGVGHIAICQDPIGAVFALHQPAPGEAPGE